MKTDLQSVNPARVPQRSDEKRCSVNIYFTCVITANSGSPQGVKLQQSVDKQERREEGKMSQQQNKDDKPHELINTFH